MACSLLQPPFPFQSRPHALLIGVGLLSWCAVVLKRLGVFCGGVLCLFVGAVVRGEDGQNYGGGLRSCVGFTVWMVMHARSVSRVIVSIHPSVLVRSGGTFVFLVERLCVVCFGKVILGTYHVLTNPFCATKIRRNLFQI